MRICAASGRGAFFDPKAVAFGWSCILEWGHEGLHVLASSVDKRWSKEGDYVVFKVGKREDV